MIFLLVLAAATGAAACWQGARGTFSARAAARLGLAAAMVVAGLAHLVMPTPFLQHLPPWVPEAAALIALTGVIEIVLGLALMLPDPWRQRAGIALAGYLVAVFPGNVYVAIAGVEVDGQPGGWYPWLRLPLQALFIGWAVWSTRGAQVAASDTTDPAAGEARRSPEPVTATTLPGGPRTPGSDTADELRADSRSAPRPTRT